MYLAGLVAGVDDTVRDRMFDVLFGLQGQLDWFGGADWEIAAHHNRYDIDSIGNGYLLRSAFQGYCPNCMLGKLFNGLLRPRHACAVCGMPVS